MAHQLMPLKPIPFKLSPSLRRLFDLDNSGIEDDWIVPSFQKPYTNLAICTHHIHIRSRTCCCTRRSLRWNIAWLSLATRYIESGSDMLTNDGKDVTPAP